VTPDLLAEALGEPPAPYGPWHREAVYGSAAARRAGADPAALAERLRTLPGVARAEVRPGGFLLIALAVPGLIAEAGPRVAGGSGSWPWPDLPRTWENPGFAVRYAHARAAAVLRWAGELGVTGEFRPGELTGPEDLAVLRALAEVPSRSRSADPGWAAYLVRLAEACHDAFERAPALPAGDEAVAPRHVARVRLAAAAREVLRDAAARLNHALPDRM
jgi:arginyl-tRNA synthetase